MNEKEKEHPLHWSRSQHQTQIDANNQQTRPVTEKTKANTALLGRFCYKNISLIGHLGLQAFEHLTKLWPSSSRPWVQAGLSTLGVLTIGLGLLYYFMGTRALPVGFFKGQIERALAANFNGANIQIGDALLQRDTQQGGFFVRLTNLMVTQTNGNVIAQSPETAIGLKFFPLLIGSVVPDSLSLIGPRLHLVRNDQGEWSFLKNRTGIQKDSRNSQKLPDDQAGLSAQNLERIGDLIQQGLAGAHKQLQLSKALSYIGVRDARIILHQKPQDHGQVWLLPSFTLQYDQDEEKRLIGSGLLQPEDAPNSEVWFAMTHSQGDRFFDMKSRLQNVVPSQLSTFIPALSSLSAVNVGVSGAFQGRVDLNEGIYSGQLKVILSEGEIGLFGPEGPLFTISRGSFEFGMEGGAKHIVMQQGELEYPSGRVSLKGDIWRAPEGSGPQDWRFQLYSTEGEIFALSKNEATHKIDEFGFSGRLFATKLPVSIDEMRLQVGKSLILMAHDGSKGFPSILRGQLRHIPLSLLKVMWPQEFLKKNRDMIFDTVKAGVIHSGTFAFNAFEGQQQPLKVANAKFQPRIKDTSVYPNMKLEIQDLTYSIFQDPMFVNTKKAKVQIKGKQLQASMAQGHVKAGKAGTINLSEGQLNIPDYWEEEPEGTFQFKIASNAQTALAMLQREPFLYELPARDVLGKVKGDVNGKLKMTMPFKDKVSPEDIFTQGQVKLSNANLELGSFKVKNSDINFSLGRNHVEAKGALFVNGASASLVWRQQLNPSPGYQPPPMLVRAVIDEADRNQLGLPLNDIIQGPVPVEIAFHDNDKGNFDIHVTSDLTKATLVSHGLGWRKKKGRSANLKFDVVTDERTNNQKISLKNIHISGVDLTAKGHVELDEDLQVKNFDFPQISYKTVSNIAIAGNSFKRGAKKFWKVKANGKAFDGRGILRSLLHTGQIGSGKSNQSHKADGIDLTANFQTVVGWGQSNLKDFQIKMKRKADELEAFHLKGQFLNGGKLNGSLVSKVQQNPVIEIKTNNAGEALRFVGFYPNMLRGDGRLLVRYNVKKRQLASQTGQLVIKRFSIASDPVIKEVLADAQKGKKGKALASQNQIPFSKLVAPFSIGHEQFVLHDSFMKGDVLGATMRGQLDFARNRVRLSGTYIPLYGLNAAVGAVPVLGDILVGRRGEGMLGITFGVYGNINKPEVLVNPMSLVAPGVFRQIFEFEQKAPKIKARPDTSKKGTVKLDSSASKVQRRKKGSPVNDKRPPETSASSVQRR